MKFVGLCKQERAGGRTRESTLFFIEQQHSLEAEATCDVQRPAISHEHFCGMKLADRVAAASAACNCTRRRWLMDVTGADDFMSERLRLE